MIPDLPIDIDLIKGFLAPDEAAALYQHALQASSAGPVLEIGSYCGKSTVCLGLACQRNDSILFALDHHRGSEEHQIGEMFHDPELFDSKAESMDSFREFRRNIRAAGLEEVVVPIVALMSFLIGVVLAFLFVLVHIAGRRWASAGRFDDIR